MASAFAISASALGRADSFFFLQSGPPQGFIGDNQWISSDAKAGRPDFGRIQMPAWLPRRFAITGCRVYAGVNGGGPVGDQYPVAYWVQLSLAIDHGGRSFATGDPNVAGGQAGADFSHDDTLCVTGAEWGKYADRQEFLHPQIFDRDAGDLLWLTLGTAAPVAWVNFQINWDPVQ